MNPNCYYGDHKGMTFWDWFIAHVMHNTGKRRSEMYQVRWNGEAVRLEWIPPKESQP